MKRRTLIVAAVRAGIGAAYAAQCGLLAVLVVTEPALVFDAGQPRLYVVKFRRGNDVFVARRQDAGDLRLRALDTIRGLRVIGEDLGHRSWLVLLQVLNLFEEGDECLRIIA